MSPNTTFLPLGLPPAAMRVAGLFLPLTLLAACATAPPPNGALSSYSGMTKSKAIRTQASVKVDDVSLRAAKTLRLEPVTFAAETAGKATSAQLALMGNAMERTLCARLSTRFEIVGPRAPADLTLKTVVTRIKPSGAGFVAASMVISRLSPVPFTPKRAPLGLGGFTAEGEATDPAGRQDAAMIWSRDADIYTDSRISSIGDAYNFSGAFARDLSGLLITGKDPVHDLALPQMPHRGKAASACASYGKGPGVAGFIGSRLGAPPEWTDGKRLPPVVSN